MPAGGERRDSVRGETHHSERDSNELDHSETKRGETELLRRRHPWRRLLFMMVSVVFLYVAFNLFGVVTSTYREDRVVDATAVVLGAAQYDGEPSGVFAARLDHAASLYEDHAVDKVILTGGSQRGDRFSEAYSGLTYLRNKGLPEKDLVVINNGSSTYESLTAANRVMTDDDRANVVFVSDSYHSYRLIGIGRELGMEAYVSPSQTSRTLNSVVRETAIVSVGRIISYRRLTNLTN